MKYFIFLNLFFLISSHTAQAGLIHAYFKLQSILEAKAIEEQRKCYIRSKTQQIFLEHSSSYFERIYRDKVTEAYLKSKAKNLDKNTVFLALGNSERPLTTKEKAEIAQLANELESNQFQIAYDYDSNAAEVIEHFVNSSNRIGITGEYHSKLIHGFTLENPFPRMQQILQFKKIIISPHSLLGIGLLLEGTRESNQFLIFDPKQNSESTVSHFSNQSWKASFQKDNHSTTFPKNHLIAHDPLPLSKFVFNFLLQTFHREQYPLNHRSSEITEENDIEIPPAFRHQIFHDKRQLVEWLTEHRIDSAYSDKKLPLSPTIPEILSSISGTQLIESYKRSKNSLNLSLELSHYLKSDQRTPFEVALLLSNQTHHFFNPLEEECINVLIDHRLPTITDRSSSCLRTAKRLVSTKGIQTFERPILNGPEHFSLVVENFRVSEFQDQTLMISNFQEEIPVFLKRRALIIATPGGSETIRTLATIFIHTATNLEHFPPIIFIGTSYYGELFSWLKHLNLPSKVKTNLFLINSSQELAELLDKI